MNESEILNLIKRIKNGEISDENALKYLKNYPFSDIGCAKLDTQRELRSGIGEVIYGEGKTVDEILTITKNLAAIKQNILITRADEQVFELIYKHFKEAKFNMRAKTISLMFKKQNLTDSYIAIISAGTSDMSVVEEAYETANF